MVLLWAYKSVRVTIFVERKILLANNENNWSDDLPVMVGCGASCCGLILEIGAHGGCS